MNETKRASCEIDERNSIHQLSKRGMSGMNETPPQGAQRPAASPNKQTQSFFARSSAMKRLNLLICVASLTFHSSQSEANYIPISFVFSFGLSFHNNKLISLIYQFFLFFALGCLLIHINSFVWGYGRSRHSSQQTTLQSTLIFSLIIFSSLINE